MIPHTNEHKRSYDLERSTMRIKANAIKTDELVPVYKETSAKERMSNGINLRGEKAIHMFERNFKRSRLGNASKSNKEYEKNNIELITTSHEDEKMNNKSDNWDTHSLKPYITEYLKPFRERKPEEEYTYDDVRLETFALIVWKLQEDYHLDYMTAFLTANPWRNLSLKRLSLMFGLP